MTQVSERSALDTSARRSPRMFRRLGTAAGPTAICSVSPWETAVGFIAAGTDLPICLRFGTLKRVCTDQSPGGFERFSCYKLNSSTPRRIRTSNLRFRSRSKRQAEKAQNRLYYRIISRFGRIARERIDAHAIALLCGFLRAAWLQTGKDTWWKGRSCSPKIWASLSAFRTE